MSEESGSEPPAVGAWLRDRYHRLALTVIVAFMLWKRLTPYDSFVRDSGVFFSGNDAFYHFREVSYTVRHWPLTMPFDPWTQFPYGTSQGQFGTLWDQAIATAALIIGLGSPTDRLVAEVTVAAPAVAGALLALPVYGIASRVADRRAGIVAAVLLALFPGTVLRRSLAGFSDHHVAEMVLQATAIFATVVALQVANRERPVLEQVTDRDWAGLKQPALWSGVAGLAVVAYLWTWPPGVVIVGIFGVFYAIAASVEFVREGTVEHVAFVGAVSLGVTAVVLALSSPTLETSTTRLSVLQVLLAALVAVECLGLVGLDRIWDRIQLNRQQYPVVVAAGALLGALVLLILAPELFKSIQNSALRAFGLKHTDQSLTIAEAQSPPLGSLPAFFQQQYGLTYLTAAGGLILLAWQSVVRDSDRTERILLAVWTVFVVLMALTQRRFNYYLAASVAVLSGILVARVIDWVDFPAYEDLVEVEVYQVLTITVLAMLLVFPLTPVMYQGGRTVFNGAAQSGPGAVTTWDEGLEWMSNGTPSPEGDRFKYYGTYDVQDDFAYPEQAYGVMSWWDYGHWITVQGERIPVANPFQQNPRPASAFFQARTERRSVAILDALPVTSDVDDRSTAELEAIANNRTAQQRGEDIRYVMIDDQMAAGKFSAITKWAGPRTEEHTAEEPTALPGLSGTYPLRTTGKRYDDTLLAGLYLEDANELEHYRLVHEVDTYSTIGSLVTERRSGPPVSLPLQASSGRGYGFVIRRAGLHFPSWSETAANASRSLARANQQDQAVRLPLPNRFGKWWLHDAHVESRVKTFERVPGATITGEVDDENRTVIGFVELELQNTGRQFVYTTEGQVSENGSFRMTVPYSTGDPVPVSEGGTNTVVQATGKFNLIAVPDRFAGNPKSVVGLYGQGLLQPSASGNVSIPDRAVLDGQRVTADLAPVEVGNNTTENGTVGGGSSGNSTDSTTGTDDGGDSTGSTNGTSGTPTPTPTVAKDNDSSG